MISVLVCDDHQVIRDGLHMVLSSDPEVGNIETCASSADALRLLADHGFDVAIVDVRLDELNGLDVIKRIREERPDTRVVVLTAFMTDELVVESAALGVSALFDKSRGMAELVDRIHEVAAGRIVMSTNEIREAHRRLEAKGFAQLSELGDVDREIVSCIGRGMTDREIASRVYLSPQTVRNRVSRLLTNLGRDNRTQLALLVTEYDDLLHRFAR